MVWKSEGGIEWRLEDGLIDFKLTPHAARGIVEELRRLIRGVASGEVQTAFGMDRIHRASRMCWEALERGTVSSLDARDCEVLYEVRQLEPVEWVFAVLNQVRSLLSAAGTAPDTADRYAKTVSAVMLS